MPKKTTILIVILAIVTGILIFLAVRSDETLQIGKTILNTNPSPTTVKPYASLMFGVSQFYVDQSPNNGGAVDIMINTYGKPVSGAQVELFYDPKVVTNVTVSQPEHPFFGPQPNVLINTVDPSQGRISYAVAIPANGKEKTGSGSIATLHMTINKFAGVPTSQITFLPKSEVMTLSTLVSVLNTTSPLTIILTPGQTTPAPTH